MLSLRVSDYQSMSTMAPHRHDEPSVIVVVAGRYRERIEGRVTEHMAGRIVWYPAGATHSQTFGSEGARKIVFTPAASSIEYLRDKGVQLDVPKHVDVAITPQISQRMLGEMRNRDPFTPLAVEGFALELIAAFARADRHPSGTQIPRWLRSVRDSIRQSDDEDLSLHQIAVMVGRHPVHLAREFRRFYGVSVGEYKRQLRLERAAAMLSGNAGLMEVALTCGFSSHSRLSRAFKAAYGVSPSQFRAST